MFWLDVLFVSKHFSFSVINSNAFFLDKNNQAMASYVLVVSLGEATRTVCVFDGEGKRWPVPLFCCR